MDAQGNFAYREDEGAYYILCNLDSYIDSMQEEPVSEDLEKACEQLAENARKHKAETLSPFFSQTDYRQGVIDGAKWQKEQMITKAVEVKNTEYWVVSVMYVLNGGNVQSNCFFSYFPTKQDIQNSIGAEKYTILHMQNLTEEQFDKLTEREYGTED